jgi:hypothetical protein
VAHPLSHRRERVRGAGGLPRLGGERGATPAECRLIVIPATELVAVALKDLAQAPLEPWSGSARAALGAGLVLYLGGHAAVVWRGNGHVLLERLAVIPVLAATVAFSPLPAGSTAILLAVELWVALLLEGRRWRRVMTPDSAAA